MVSTASVQRKLLTAACVPTIVYVLYISWKPDISPFPKFSIASTTSDATGYEPNQSAIEDGNAARPRQQAAVHVALFGDKKMFPGLMTLATSIVTNTRSDVMLHFVTLPVDAKPLRTIIDGSALSTVPHEVLTFSEDRVKGIFVVRSPRIGLNHSLNAARFFLAEMLPNVERVIYIDADCLVLGDVKELYDVKIEDHHVIAAVNSCQIARGRVAASVFNFTHPAVVAANIPPDTCILNGGVFVVNLTRWRQEDIGPRSIQWMKLNARSLVVRLEAKGPGTQAIMLLTLHDKFTSIPLQWNVLSELHNRPPDNYKLIHWNADHKPWLFKRGWAKSRGFLDVWERYYNLFTSRLNHPALRLFLDSS